MRHSTNLCCRILQTLLLLLRGAAVFDPLLTHGALCSALLHLLLLIPCCVNVAVAAAALPKAERACPKRVTRAQQKLTLSSGLSPSPCSGPELAALRLAARHAGCGATGDDCNALLALLEKAAAAAASVQQCAVMHAAVTDLLQVTLHRCSNVARAALAP